MIDHFNDKRSCRAAGHLRGRRIILIIAIDRDIFLFLCVFECVFVLSFWSLDIPTEHSSDHIICFFIFWYQALLMRMCGVFHKIGDHRGEGGGVMERQSKIGYKYLQIFHMYSLADINWKKNVQWCLNHFTFGKCWKKDFMNINWLWDEFTKGSYGFCVMLSVKKK